MVDSDTHPIPFTEYFEVLYNTDEIQKLLREQVRLFTLLYLTAGTRMEKQKVWNTNNSSMKDLDRLIQKTVTSDIHAHGLTVNLGV